MIYSVKDVDIFFDGVKITDWYCMEDPRRIYTKCFTYERVDNVIHAHGKGWEYKQVGSLTKFTQSGKVPSLRVIKTLIKELNKSMEGD